MSTFQVKKVAVVVRNALHLVPHHIVDFQEWGNATE